jgi:RNAse (barnase) inhibitor barstar
MPMNTLNSSSTDAILIVPPEKSTEVLDTFVSKKYAIFSVDGTGLNSKEELLSRLSQAMKFPSYFGSNWDALEECLNDLEWLPAKGYVIQFKNADNFIKRYTSDFEVFTQIIESVSSSWKRKKADFILVVETNNPNSMSRFSSKKKTN